MADARTPTRTRRIARHRRNVGGVQVVRAARGALALPAFTLILCLFLISGCATTAKTVTTQSGALTVQCAVPEARVYVDDTFVGRAGSLKVAAGLRRVEVRADGWFTAYREVEVPARGAARLDVDLRKIPDGEPGG
jgi:hypothetical protein